MQASRLQDSSSRLDPLHDNPPFNGAGLSQVRVLVMFPLPQVVEHELKLLQFDQPPSNSNVWKMLKS
jgi:hypothetical protein